jgi:type IV pilus assembly protein PilM
MHRKHSAIGIDIGDHAVKCAQLETHQGRLRVREVSCVEIAGGANERSSRRQRILEAAQRALRDGDYRGKECLSSLRLFETTTRHIRIPAGDLEKAAEVLSRELRENEQETSEEFSFQFEPVTELVDQGQRKREYLCCVADPLIVREHLDILAGVGLRPLAIDLDACAQVRPFIHGAGEEDGPLELCIDLGCRCARLIISRGARPVLMRTVPVGGADILKTLEQKLQLDFQTVRDLAEASRNGDSKEIAGLTSAICRTLSGHIDVIVSRVLECARYAATLFGGRSLESLRVLGGAASLPGVVDYLSKNLSLPVADDDPFRALGVERPRTATNVAPAMFATALGLAMRGLPG